MRDRPRPAPPRHTIDETAAAALAAAAAGIARLDQALTGHPLAPAVLHRARLAAVRQAAAADGHLIDPWHLAAILEGLRLRMDPSLAPAERGAIFDAARHALAQYQWLVAPDPAQEAAIAAAGAVLAASPGGTPLLIAAHGLHAWLSGAGGADGAGGAGGAGEGGADRAPSGDRPAVGNRPPLGGDRRAGRAALLRFWPAHGLLRLPYPLLAAAALRPDTPWAPAAWVPAFLDALAAEAADGLQLLTTLERTWRTARARAAGPRATSRAAAAIDVLATTPLVSATALGQALGMAVNNAAALLERFRADGIAVEVTHRSKRRLYGLAGLAPLRAATAPPRRPEPGRGRGRPRLLPPAAEVAAPPPPLPPLGPLERRAFDERGLAAAMAFADQAIRHARHVLGQGDNGADVADVADVAAAERHSTVV